MADAVRAEMREWLDANWDLTITVREWWGRLAEAGWSVPSWPAPYGRGVSLTDARAVTEELVRVGAIAPPMGHIGVRLAGPTLLQHANESIQRTYLPPLLRGEEAWCQLFSEPGAGSDLPSLSTSAVRDGDAWMLNGQKVWNSGADTSRRGLLLARTDPESPKRDGISCFVLDMGQPGVEARPLRMMTGEAHFCEVFITDAHVAATDLVGEENRGWTVARTVLALERATATEADARGLVVVPSGEESGQLDRVVGDVLDARATRKPAYTVSALRSRDMIALARELGVTDDPPTRQDLARYYALTEIHRWNQRRAKAAARTGRPSPEGAITKLVLGRICNLSRDLSFSMLGASAMLAGDDSPRRGALVTMGLSSPGVTIGAGTDEIQRNTVGERVLGLPREPHADIDPRAKRR